MILLLPIGPSQFCQRYKIMYVWTVAVIREWLSKESLQSFMLLQIQSPRWPMTRLMPSLIFSGKNLDIFRIKLKSMVCAQEGFFSQICRMVIHICGMNFTLCLTPVSLTLLHAVSHPKDLNRIIRTVLGRCKANKRWEGFKLGRNQSWEEGTSFHFCKTQRCNITQNVTNSDNTNFFVMMIWSKQNVLFKFLLKISSNCNFKYTGLI